jgi:hypothetical protein
MSMSMRINIRHFKKGADTGWYGDNNGNNTN